MRVSGRVIKGSGKAGSVYGVPTANLEIVEPLNLNQGVYTAMTFFAGETYPSVVCYRLLNQRCIFEVHLLDFAGDLYNQTIDVELVEILSHNVAFQHETQMRQKIHADLERARYVFRNHPTNR